MRYWKRVDGQGKTTTVESYSHGQDVDGAVEIDQAEYNAFIAALPSPVITPPRDIAAELDDLKADLKARGIID